MGFNSGFKGLKVLAAEGRLMQQTVVWKIGGERGATGGHPAIFFFFFLFNQQSACKVFYKLMGWLAVYLVDLLA